MARDESFLADVPTVDLVEEICARHSEVVVVYVDPKNNIAFRSGRIVSAAGLIKYADRIVSDKLAGDPEDEE